MDRKISLPKIATSSDASCSSGRASNRTVSNPFSIDSILSTHLEQQQQQQQQHLQQQQLQQQQLQQLHLQQHLQQQLQQANETMSHVKIEINEQQSSPVANPNFLYLLTMMLERQQQMQQHQNVVNQRQLQQAIIEQQQQQQQQLRQQAQLQQQRNLANIHLQQQQQQQQQQHQRRHQQQQPHLNTRMAHSNTNFINQPQQHITPVLPPAPPKTNSHAPPPCNSRQQMLAGEKLDMMKPAHSYIGLIGMCILSTPEKRMVLSDIYQFILDNYPYYRNRGSGWRNSVRHNLSLNECFQKTGRAANGKGHYWTIHPANMEDFMAGDFRRRRAQRKVRRWNNMDVPSDESEDEDATKPPLPEHFKRSIEMHRRLEVLRYQKQQAAAASLSMANAAAASLSMANAAAAAAALAVATQNNNCQLQLQAADNQQPKVTEASVAATSPF